MFPPFRAEYGLLELSKYVSRRLVQIGVLALDQELSGFDGVDLVFASSLFDVVNALLHVARNTNDCELFCMTKTSLTRRTMNTTARRYFKILETKSPTRAECSSRGRIADLQRVHFGVYLAPSS